MKNTVLFDLGNTLAHYFDMHEFPEILKEAITEVRDLLLHEGILRVSRKDMWRRMREEDYESSDYRVRPLEERLFRIFQIGNLVQSSDTVRAMCRRFMKPIFARSHLYEDTLPTLKELKLKAFKTAIVSNTTWGSPADLWREHIESLGLNRYVDATVFCRDVGWRKPARQIFEYTLERLQVRAENCVFVGDDPRWDLAGPKAVGVQSIIVNRKRAIPIGEEEITTIDNLNALLDKLKLFH